MGCSDRYDYDPVYEDRQNQTHKYILVLGKLPASRFSVDEISFILQCGKSEFKTAYYESDHERADALYYRECCGLQP